MEAGPTIILPIPPMADREPIRPQYPAALARLVPMSLLPQPIGLSMHSITATPTALPPELAVIHMPPTEVMPSTLRSSFYKMRAQLTLYSYVAWYNYYYQAQAGQAAPGQAAPGQSAAPPPPPSEAAPPPPPSEAAPPPPGGHDYNSVRIQCLLASIVTPLTLTSRLGPSSARSMMFWRSSRQHDVREWVCFICQLGDEAQRLTRRQSTGTAICLA